MKPKFKIGDTITVISNKAWLVKRTNENRYIIHDIMRTTDIYQYSLQLKLRHNTANCGWVREDHISSIYNGLQKAINRIKNNETI